MTKARKLADLGNVYDDGALSNRNLIINGAMQVAQRGTSSTSANYQTVDRWRNNFGSVTLTQSQEDLTSGDPFDQGFRSFLRLTQSGSASAATDYAQISQRIEGLNAATSGWNYKSSGGHVACSFWVRSSLAGTYYIYMQTRSSSGDGYINVPFTVAANTWTKVTASIAGNSSLNIDNDNTTGIEFRIIPYYGTDYTSSALPSNTWYYGVGSGELPDFAQNWCATSGATFDITGVQLEVGDTATPFEHRSYGDELQRCQRYYQYFEYNGYQGFPVTFRGSNSPSIGSSPIAFLPRMRADPTVSLDRTINLTLYRMTDGAAVTVSSGMTSSALHRRTYGPLELRVGGTADSGISNGVGYSAIASNSGYAKFKIDAEL